MQHLVDRDAAEPFIAGIEPDPSHQSHQATVDADSLTALQAWQLYTSHFLSMWMSRTYEYGAILFIQAAFPGNLLANSIYGITETLCVLVFSPSLGKWVDSAASRLRPLLTTIIANRASLVLSCLLWTFLELVDNAHLKRLLFAIILALSMVEKVARMTNILSMERDWVPTLANTRDTVVGTNYSLTQLNTSMRRIDIMCKFLAPLAISAYVAATSPSMGAFTIAGTATVSAVAECFAVVQVWRQNAKLHADRIRPPSDGTDIHDERTYLSHSTSQRKSTWTCSRDLSSRNLLAWLAWSFDTYKNGLGYYIKNNMLVPSLCVAILHGSVLAWSGTLVTWLLNAGFPLKQVTVAKALGSIFEIGSTIVFPLAMTYMDVRRAKKKQMSGARYAQLQDVSDDEDESSEARSSEERTKNQRSVNSAEDVSNAILIKHTMRIAQLSILSLSLALIPTVISLFVLASRLPKKPDDLPPPQNLSESAAAAFIAFLSISFLGRWTFDLSVTQLEQTTIALSHRSSFAGTEQAVVSSVSIVHWISAAIFHSQASFKWLALGSFVAVSGATIIFVVCMSVYIGDLWDPDEH